MVEGRYEGHYEERGPAERRYERGVPRPYISETATLAPPTRRISWGAVFAGSVVALITQFTLTLLGIGIGAATINPVTEQQPFAGLGIGAAIWFAATTIIALFVGGLIAARVANIPRRADAILHGVVTWGLVFVASVYFATSAVGSLLGGVTGIVGQGVSAATQGVAQGAAGAQQPGQALERLGERARQAFPQGGQAGARAEQVGQQAAEGLSAAAFGGFVVLLLGLGAAIAGAFLGKPKRMLRDEIEHEGAVPVAH